MTTPHYLDNPRVREICEEDSNFREHLEAAWGKPPLPEGYVFDSFAIQIDGCTVVQKTAEIDYSMDIELESDDWTTNEIFMDNELVHAAVNGISEPLIDRTPQSYTSSF
jgi:hypothetical protein